MVSRTEDVSSMHEPGRGKPIAMNMGMKAGDPNILLKDIFPELEKL